MRLLKHLSVLLITVFAFSVAQAKPSVSTITKDDVKKEVNILNLQNQNSTSILSFDHEFKNEVVQKGVSEIFNYEFDLSEKFKRLKKIIFIGKSDYVKKKFKILNSDVSKNIAEQKNKKKIHRRSYNI